MTAKETAKKEIEQRMSNQDINENFELAHIWIDWYCSILYLNANIKLRSMENRRNYSKIEYYNNYDKFTPMIEHPIHYKTISEFKVATINTSKGNNILLFEHWKSLINPPHKGGK